MSEHTLSGKNVLIAGGAKNLGGLIARQAAEAGANVAVHFNSDETRSDAEQTVEAVRASGGRAEMFQADLTVPANVTRLFDDAEKALGTIDVAVNTVGKVLRKPMAETTEEEYDSMFDINSKSAYFFIKEAGQHLADGGKIVTIVTALL
ncbi:SDR family oxidoreductase, partial [Rothia koreensis]